jgi:serine/threonine-protein kinase
MGDYQRLTLPQSIQVIIDILQGLDHAHQQGIIHCDLKPENILLNLQPHGWTARISDFGIARLQQELAGQGMGNTGSPAYMAPERFYGQYPMSSDLYAVGVLLFELLTGYRPFSGTPVELMSAHLNRPLKIPDAVPEVWHPILQTALQKLSARRFHTAAEMLTAIREAAAQDGFDWWLNAQQIRLPLLESQAVPLGMFQFRQREALTKPIRALAIADLKRDRPPETLPDSDQFTYPRFCFYRAVGQQVVQTYEVDPSETWNKTVQDRSIFEFWQDISPLYPIQELFLRPQGCFVTTHRSVHLIPNNFSGVAIQQPRLLLTLDQSCLTAIEAQGRWFATLDNPQESFGLLSFWNLPHVLAPAKPVAPPYRIRLQPSSTQPPQLLSLDNNHVVLFTGAPALKPRLKAETLQGSYAQVWTRRGQGVGTLQFPMRLGKVIATLSPYRFLAIDEDNPGGIVFIDLKPYRIARWHIGIQPHLIQPTDWGFILVDAEGEIVLLDEEGQVLGRLEGPPNVTAIASFNQHNLLIATWDLGRGQLYTLDLRELDIELLF